VIAEVLSLLMKIAYLPSIWPFTIDSLLKLEIQVDAAVSHEEVKQLCESSWRGRAEQARLQHMSQHTGINQECTVRCRRDQQRHVQRRNDLISFR
jgi:hypothetical protein